MNITEINKLFNYIGDIAETELRFYVLNTEDISSGKSFKEITENEWIEECERQGRVYSTEGFQRAFNEEEINTNTDVLKILTVNIYKKL